MKNQNIAQKAYNAYRSEWMRKRGFSIDDLIDGLECQREKMSPNMSLYDIFRAWEQDVGFDGEIWMSWSEFLDVEFPHSRYIRTLLGDDDDFNEYIAYCQNNNIEIY